MRDLSEASVVIYEQDSTPRLGSFAAKIPGCRRATGTIDDTIFPQRMLLDCARVYRKKGDEVR